MAQPLRFSQIGFAALQLGGPFRHLRLEFVVGFTKLLLALAYRFLGAAVIVEEACRPKCRCGMIRRHGKQQLVNLGRKVSVITCRRDQAALGIDANGNDDAPARRRAAADVGNDLLARAGDNGEAALKILEEKKIDFVIADVYMPIMNGLNFYKTLREKPEYEKLPFLFVSGFDDDDPVICTYDLSKFGASVVMDIMRTHPVVIIGEVLQENPFFVPPDQFLLEIRERRGSARAR